MKKESASWLMFLSPGEPQKMIKALLEIICHTSINIAFPISHELDWWESVNLKSVSTRIFRRGVSSLKSELLIFLECPPVASKYRSCPFWPIVANAWLPLDCSVRSVLLRSPLSPILRKKKWRAGRRVGRLADTMPADISIAVQATVGASV